MPDESQTHALLTGDGVQTATCAVLEIPERVRAAIRLGSPDERAFSIACRLFAEDTGDGFGDTVSEARLDRAVARSVRDAWSHGQSSAEDLGAAYAIVGDRVARALDDTSQRGD